MTSEWYNSQKKPSSNFRKLLQERLDKTNPRRKLAKDETTKLAKLEGIAEKLKRGESVQNRHLQTWLSEDEYAQMTSEWDTQRLFREERKNKPSELKRYEDKLKEAIMMRNRSDGYHRKGKKSAAYKLDSKSESLCEDALEILKEIVAADASLQI
jgi:hypothetical protein